MSRLGGRSRPSRVELEWPGSYPPLQSRRICSTTEDVATMAENAYELHPIGVVESPLTDRETAPKQGFEGSPDAWLAFDPAVAEGIRDLEAGSEIIVLTWLHQASRDVLSTRPRDDPANPVTGVFSTRSPDRPNPIGLHLVEILSIDGMKVQVRNLEALDGTPIIDVKPILRAASDT
jgi:tRNA-Thr(GGU) m(6)t(6)A37 methyltransferase TsaA